MTDKMKELLNRVLEWWNKFTAKQKTIIISAAAVVILMIVIIVTVLTRPQYVLLLNCETTKQAAEVTELLEGNGINHQVSSDGYQIKVLKSQQSDANLLLGANDIQSVAYSIDNVTNGGFSTTESDKQKKYQLYMETRLEKEFIEKFAAIKSASVELSIPENDGTLISTEEEAFASILLEIDGEFTTDNAAYLARAVATAIGNTTTNNIVILDTTGNMLFSGDDNYTISGVANSQLTVKTQAESLVKNEVKRVLLGTNEFDNIEVASNLALDFSTTDTTEHTYSAPEGRTEGMLSHEDIYNSDSTNSNSGIPGTDSNDQSTYVLQDNAESSSTVSEESRDYLPNEMITNKSIPAGLIKYNESSISVTGIVYNVVREEDAKRQGLLDGITWAEYKTANVGRTKIDVETELYDVVANATGISADDITIVAYRENVFFDSEGLNVTPTDVMQILLVVVILLLLAFVIFRSMRGDKEQEAETELSVEALLQSAPVVELENIGLETESETRKMIDKFVTENPEAAASLLRNWLNEDWG
ncbi:flagellar M-ring protein FliF C-terminal domain-containing protein [Kineothrix sp. MB12-C1]|uniref:flagellar M-ring protein FliF C-terminal domain-containing protein n=1 Tax=Kineothrix sp. MB12-C1 TaxID=3070215 RepID=UPI0027D2F341|nr:flagellar M-ring protein FliF C-terminal domain-containing protein [Kineothrix sp. MB12-C1]WMC93020.1 flagellar M-ring protein FliF C-terminal domain-containing protein [Kineothrix sp. MB12-C1]